MVYIAVTVKVLGQYIWRHYTKRPSLNLESPVSLSLISKAKSLRKKREAISNRRAALLSELKSKAPASSHSPRQLFMREQRMQKCFRFGVAR